MEVAVFYYRYGYSPSHYTSDDFWNLRLNVERSRAIKCPRINYVLAGTKRVQQVIARPGMLERWLDVESSEIIRETFMGLYSFEAGEATDSIKRARNEPKKYILKPQRDGGGNNYYYEDMLDKLATTKQDELAAFTLMEKIFPPEQENVLVNGMKEPSICNVVNELGIFGAVVMDERENVLMNEGAGFLLRSKPSTKTEGDLMRGTSSLDSPWLCDNLACLN